MPDIIDRIEKILANLSRIGGVEACIVASRDGLHICSVLQKEQFAESIAAMSATMLGAAETTAIGLGLILLGLEKAAEELKELLI
ncbi:roadblock/LC7 domain-containing protein [Candidatus Methanoperedens nitratireducens]|uniref:Putative Roadblock/LC7 family protein n=1 Tax=Candidatus Methanoperedens nitratireducens TaxID=1392998 RepID=A0A284VL47_9EURY|nr:roadblock/LC7 domain-containing protein [Candidatus Methanoperedens nitroreducens]SNQ60006.1 putative Roadblock/LC7 family protein [Candidatus Methanoperedens nitroreducens]